MTTDRTGRNRLCFLVFIILVSVILFLVPLHSNLHLSKALDLQTRIEDLTRMNGSVSSELRDIESNRQNTPDLALPERLTADTVPDFLEPISKRASQNCGMHSCFDYSRCPLTSSFPVYLYNPDVYPNMNQGWAVEGFIKTTLKQTLGHNPHLTHNPKEACVFLVLIGELVNTKENVIPPLDTNALKKLPYWGGDGRNHILLNLSRGNLSSRLENVFRDLDTGRAILIQSTFSHLTFRAKFDLIVPPILGPPSGDVWNDCVSMLPARRKYLLSFQGQMKQNLDLSIIDHLKKMRRGTTFDKFYFEFECCHTKKDNGSDWGLCGTKSSRKAILKVSTFALILSPGNPNLVSTVLLQARVYEALRAGAIPVILGGDRIELSYSEVISWRRICIFLPRSRVTELHFLLRTFPDTDLLSFRRQGRLIWERYLSTFQTTVDTILAVLRDRLGIPPKPVASIKAVSVFNSTFKPRQIEVKAEGTEPKESLGPLEPPYASPAFRRNYSLMLSQGYDVWNTWGDPFRLYPQLPFDTLLPSDAKFLGSGVNFRPIAKGSGKEFSKALGGNNPREQFTVIILTYERELILTKTLSRLHGLPYLNKVVVIWNSPRPPSEYLQWPDIGVPIHVVKTTRNSLNNRFLPLDIIETEGVLSVDDDVHLRHDEIIFAFRVWREHRDRIVGFPGRFHAWDSYHHSWLYYAGYSCELSMVLSGAAFIHKYYMYLYWYTLPQAIRDKVDEYMNCEDIAMNFLVSHVTQKPPVKVTSRRTFPGRRISLSNDKTHYNERHKCINFFTQVFGYTPLLNTQYRADSVLFETELPYNKQKCFKFI